jgi:hypothetical protein
MPLMPLIPSMSLATSASMCRAIAACCLTWSLSPPRPKLFAETLQAPWIKIHKYIRSHSYPSDRGIRQWSAGSAARGALYLWCTFFNRSIFTSNDAISFCTRRSSPRGLFQYKMATPKAFLTPYDIVPFGVTYVKIGEETNCSLWEVLLTVSCRFQERYREVSVLHWAHSPSYLRYVSQD